MTMMMMMLLLMMMLSGDGYVELTPWSIINSKNKCVSTPHR